MEFTKINYRDTALIGDWYIAISCCDAALWSPTTLSASAGRWHRGSRGQVVREKAMKRVSFYRYSDQGKAAAINKLKAFIDAMIAESEKE